MPFGTDDTSLLKVVIKSNEMPHLQNAHPVLLYGCESLMMKTSDEKLISTVDRKLLSALFGTLPEDEGWRRRHKFELRWDFGDSGKISTIRLGTVVSINENWAFSVLF